MRTYRELFATPEFTPLFGISAIQVAAQTVSGLGLGTLVYAATGSPLLSALALFGPSLAQVVGAVTLLSAADRLPSRAAMTGMGLAFGLGTAVLAIPGLPLAAAFAIVLGLGLVASLDGGVRYGLLNEILAADGYLLGRSVLNMSVGAMQICGFAAGGVLVTVISPRGTLIAGAALYLIAVPVTGLALSRRPPRAAGRPSITATWRINARLWSSPPRRLIYLASWVPNGLIVGCESLFIPYAPRGAGLLFAFAALGMLAGDTLTGRFLPDRWRQRIGAPLRLLLAAPYLAFALHPALPLAAAAAALASVGYAATLLLQQRLMILTPDELSGHALGLHSCGLLAMQGVGAVLAGTLALRVSPGTAIAILAAASVAVTLALAPGLAARPRPAPPGEQPSCPGALAGPAPEPSGPAGSRRARARALRRRSGRAGRPGAASSPRP